MALPLIMAGIGLGTSLFQTLSGAKQLKDGKSAYNSFERQDLNNVNKNIAIPTTGTEIMREEAQRSMAMSVNALQGAGARGLGMLPALMAQNNQANRQTQAYTDKMILDRDYAIADDEARIREIQENRDNQELAGIGQQIQTGRQDMWSGIQGMGNSLMMGLSNIPQGGRQTQGIAPSISKGFASMEANNLPASNLPQTLNLGGF